LAAWGGAKAKGECHEKPLVEHFRRIGGNRLQADSGRVRLPFSSLWPFGSGGHYIVNEEQKAMLAGHHLRMYRALFWLIVGASAIGGPLASAFMPGDMLMGLGMAAFVGLVIGLIPTMWLVNKVKPIVTTLAPAHERITQMDSFKAQAKAYSASTLIALLIIDVVMLLLAASVFFTGPSTQYMFGWVGSIIFGFATLYTIALFVSRYKQSLA
jgi:hypothetical protein